ncbi:conserved hypothetical protein [Cenarchaeum symbiosum A]|uniref:Uncharacterized protein n=1 Tax=Cenarchaeum symbiosum (strain A) TaxID=414004 RepID=A0RZ42_CENSY|nr:conserved hypothetical protein [Cenarchaeum symbiosum A]
MKHVIYMEMPADEYRSAQRGCLRIGVTYRDMLISEMTKNRRPGAGDIVEIEGEWFANKTAVIKFTTSERLGLPELSEVPQYQLLWNRIVEAAGSDSRWDGGFPSDMPRDIREWIEGRIWRDGTTVYGVVQSMMKDARKFSASCPCRRVGLLSALKRLLGLS